VEELLGQADTSDVDGDDAIGCRGADDELGRAAADVGDEERPPTRIELGGGSQKGQATLLLAPEQLGPGANDRLGQVEERRGWPRPSPPMSPSSAPARRRIGRAPPGTRA
jgi:hypothetical protein